MGVTWEPGVLSWPAGAGGPWALMTAFARLGDDLSVQAHPATYHPPTQHSYRRALSACLPQTRGPAGSQALTSVLFQDHRLATPQRPGIQTGMQALGGMCEGHCLELSTVSHS